MVPLKDKETLLPEVESLSEDCSTPVLPAQSLYCLVDVTPQSKCYCTPTNPPSDAVFRKAFLVLFTLCLCANMFSRYVCGGIAVAVAFLYLISVSSLLFVCKVALSLEQHAQFGPKLRTSHQEMSDEETHSV